MGNGASVTRLTRATGGPAVLATMAPKAPEPVPEPEPEGPDPRIATHVATLTNIKSKMEAKTEAARGLAFLAYSFPEQKAAILEAAAIPPLVELVTRSEYSTCGSIEQSAGALRMIASNDRASMRAIRDAGGIAPLLAVLGDELSTDGQKMQAAGVLRALSFDDECKTAIREAGGVEPLMALAKEGTGEQKAFASLTLLNLEEVKELDVAYPDGAYVPPEEEPAAEGA